MTCLFYEGDCDQHHTYRTTRHGYPPPQEYARPYEYANTPYQDPTLSPGPGTFKRQKCFRYAFFLQFMFKIATNIICEKKEHLIG